MILKPTFQHAYDRVGVALRRSHFNLINEHIMCT